LKHSADLELLVTLRFWNKTNELSTN
jgi:hypothetical protein